MNSVFTVEELFSGRFFRVPDYQRGYAWEKPQLVDFLDDLECLGSNNQHFTGTVVLHQQDGTILDDEGGSHTLFNVVDGQQRLTTIVLLLDAIRVYAEKSHPSIADGIRKKFIEVRDLNQQPSYKLHLNSDCHDYFVHNVLTHPGGLRDPGLPHTRDSKRRRPYLTATWLNKARTDKTHSRSGYLPSI
jgi:uncharacterized protein with ParB-like and HNH nuclease domain